MKHTSAVLSLALCSCASTGLGHKAPPLRPADVHGQLQVRGNRIVDKAGTPTQLAGMSLFWSVWGGERFFTKATVDWLVSDWQCQLVRAPMAIEPRGGYLSHPEPTIARVRAVVDAAVANGVYVIIDWHEEHADQHAAEAKAFFATMAKDYGHLPNVIFEIFNEPAGKEEPIPAWKDIKAYAEQVIPVIRQHSQNIVVVGTPTWSQRVDLAAADPLAGPNIAYTFHFYAGSHGADVRAHVDAALAKGVAVMITEWGTSHADGGSIDKTVYADKAAEWLAWADRNQLSWANWSVMDKNEASAALLPPEEFELDPDAGGWPLSRLSPSGIFVRERIRAHAGR